MKKIIPWSKVDWPVVLFLGLTPIAALIAGIFYLAVYGLSLEIALLTVFFYYACGFGITAGYHRYFAHRTYEMSLPAKLFFLFFGAGSFQFSVLYWATDHRFHHRYVDTDKDPYNAKRGFWYSHILWMFTHRNLVSTPEGQRLSKDLRRDPWVMFQHRYYYGIAMFMCFGLPTLMGWALGDALGGFIMAGLVRMAFVHHFTFFINSLCHMVGTQNYGSENTARDSWYLSIFTYGEGYHNFHHHFQNDYRNGIRWFDFDPTKWLILFLSWLGQASQLKMTPDHKIIAAKVQGDFLEITQSWQESWAPMEEKLGHLREHLQSCCIQVKNLQLEYQAHCKSLSRRKDLQMRIMRRDLKLAQRELNLRFSHWKKIVHELQTV